MLWTVALTLFVCILPTQDAKPFDWHSLNLHEEHIPYFFFNNPSIKAACEEDEACPYKEHTRTLGCWGYEKSCPEYQRMSMPSCPGDSRGWTQSKPAQVDLFWKEGDFGYIQERKEDMISMCEPQEKDDSSLKCSRHTQYCQAKNIYFDFRKSKMSEGTDRYRENMLKQGEIGGHCKFHPSRLRNEGDHKSPLQSWFAELEDYSSLNFKPIDNTKCDIIIEKPTYFIKLDAGINMYHHFCDFVNLYASQHLNNSFSTDAYIVMWDTSGYGYGDFFKETWKVHTDYPIIPLKDYDGKKVCFKEAVFSLLARMRLGMYYNMPLVPGCSDSSFFRAYSQHTLHRLNIPQYGPLDTKIRVTLLSRNTKFRNILNEKEIINALKTNGEYEVNVVEYNMKMPFLDQLEKTHNSDIFMGMHGAGLTHLLFLPDWAVAFEIYNCDDQHCYLDLARLRGVKYMTWENMDKLKQEDEGHHPQLGAHKKFTNYGFDVSEFMRMVAKAAEHVRTHSSFIEARQKKYPYLNPNQKKVEL